MSKRVRNEVKDKEPQNEAFHSELIEALNSIGDRVVEALDHNGPAASYEREIHEDLEAMKDAYEGQSAELLTVLHGIKTHLCEIADSLDAMAKKKK